MNSHLCLVHRWLGGTGKTKYARPKSGCWESDMADPKEFYTDAQRKMQSEQGAHSADMFCAFDIACPNTVTHQ